MSTVSLCLDKTKDRKADVYQILDFGKHPGVHRHHYQTVTNTLRAVLECPPTLKTFTSEEPYDWLHSGWECAAGSPEYGV
jgi:hypothetical protein